MLTSNQIKRISLFYIQSLFNASTRLLDDDFWELLDDNEGYMIFQQGFYYVSRLNEFLQGNWRNVEIDSLTNEQEERKRKETGRVCYYGDDFLIEYNGNYYDFLDVKKRSDNTITLKEYTIGSEKVKKEIQISDLNYCDNNTSEFTTSIYKNALWAIFDAMFTPFKDELITKIDKASKEGNDVGFDAILNIYRSKSLDLLENDPGVKMKVEDIIKQAKKEAKERNKKRRFNVNLPAEIDINGVKKMVTRWNELTPEEMEAYKNSIEFQERIDETFPEPSPLIYK